MEINICGEYLKKLKYCNLDCEYYIKMLRFFSCPFSGKNHSED